MQDSKRRQTKYSKKEKKVGRKQKYFRTHKLLIEKVWTLSGEICAERLFSMLNEYINELKKNQKLKNFNDDIVLDCKNISEISLKRMLAKFPKKRSRQHKSKAQIYKEVPIEAHFGKHSNELSHYEADFVEMSGGNGSGIFIQILNLSDVCTGWISRSAGLGKSQQSVETMYFKALPKLWDEPIAIHPDNAKTILNVLMEEKRKSRPGLKISRSRPYKKNDNAHVEQKNNDKIRKLVGYLRFDTLEEEELLNDFFNIEDLISNFFIPSYKLTSKQYDDKKKVIKKIYDKPKTAYHRIIQNKELKEEIKMRLTTQKESLSLTELRKESDIIYTKLMKHLKE